MNRKEKHFIKPFKYSEYKIKDFLEQAKLSLENKEPPPNFILDQQLCFCSPFFSEQLMYP